MRNKTPTCLNFTCIPSGFCTGTLHNFQGYYVHFMSCFATVSIVAITFSPISPAISAQVLLGFPVSVYKQMLGWFPILQVATACFSCSPPRSNQNAPKFMFVMFDMYVKLPPDASPIAVNKFYFTLHLPSCILCKEHKTDRFCSNNNNELSLTIESQAPDSSFCSVFYDRSTPSPKPSSK